MDDIDSLSPAYDHGHPLPSGWRRLGDAEYDVWDRFRLTFDFRRRVDPERSRGIREPRPSVTYVPRRRLSYLPRRRPPVRVFGHPWEQTMCVFGEALFQSLAVERPQLFSRVVRVDG